MRRRKEYTSQRIYEAAFSRQQAQQTFCIYSFPIGLTTADGEGGERDMDNFAGICFKMWMETEREDLRD